MKTTTDGKWAFKVLAGNYISEEDLEGLGISADWHLYLSPTEPPSAAQCNRQMNAYDLSACPCCGGRATIIGTLKTCEWSAICTMCGLETAHMMQPKDAASAWNRRHAPDEEGATPPESGGQGEVRWLAGELHAIGNNLGLGGATVRTIRAAADELERLTHPTAQASGAVTEALIVAMAENYEMVTDEGYYMPNEHERALLLDFAHEVAEALAQGGGNER